VEASGTFVRDRFTWLAYLMLAFFSYTASTRGPLIPFLREELDLNYSIAGLHLSAFAAGMVMAGLTNAPLSKRFGRGWLFWGGGAASLVFTIVFLLARTPILTISSTFLQGLTSGWMLVTIQATLSDHHKEKRAIALTESNIAASALAVLAPLAIGTLEDIGLGWRMALVLGVIGWILLALWGRDIQIPPTQQEDREVGQKSQPLPIMFWAYLVVIFLGAVVEWSIIFWGADFLEKNAGLEATTASTMMTVFFLAMVIGRGIGSRLARTFDIRLLLFLAYVVLMIGFVPFWLAPTAEISIIGLFIAGLGIANTFPLALSTASGTVTPAQSDIASGRISFGAGLAIFLGPQLLGVVADGSSISAAYTIVAVVTVLVVGVVFWANRLPRIVPTTA
jgi:predicted MFS family arabinose efflux permease